MQGLLSVSEAAARLGVSRVRVWQWIKEGRLKAERLGNAWAIRERDLAKFKPRPTGRPSGSKKKKKGKTK